MTTDPRILYDLATLAFGLTFGAGGVYFLIKQSRKDVNGLGYKVNAEIKQSARRHINLSLALMLVAQTDEQRRAIADLLKESE